jgi:hypothetical protein
MDCLMLVLYATKLKLLIISCSLAKCVLCTLGCMGSLLGTSSCPNSLWLTICLVSCLFLHGNGKLYMLAIDGIC